MTKEMKKKTAKYIPIIGQVTAMKSVLPQEVAEAVYKLAGGLEPTAINVI